MGGKHTFRGRFMLFNSIQLVFERAHSEQAVIAHACHGHTLQLSTGLSVQDSMLVVNSNPVRG